MLRESGAAGAFQGFDYANGGDGCSRTARDIDERAAPGGDRWTALNGLVGRDARGVLVVTVIVVIVG